MSKRWWCLDAHGAFQPAKLLYADLDLSLKKDAFCQKLGRGRGIGDAGVGVNYKCNLTQNS